LGQLNGVNYVNLRNYNFVTSNSDNLLVKIYSVFTYYALFTQKTQVK